MEMLNMIQDTKGFIYYITHLHGESQIMEGNPLDPYVKNHQCIYKIKTERCLAFTCENDQKFYLMDQNHLVHKLVRSKNNRWLHPEKEVTLKEIQRYDFTPEEYDNSLVEGKYCVYRSKMFYFYNILDDPFPVGIFEADTLIDENPN